MILPYIDIITFFHSGFHTELLNVNVPAGKTVTRITLTEKLSFPITAKNIRLDLLPLLEVMSKALMENLTKIINDRKRKAVVLDTVGISASPLLPLSFVGKPYF